jgi:hypothetical protein
MSKLGVSVPSTRTKYLVQPLSVRLTHWGCTTPIPFELTEELLHRRRRVEAREDKSDRERLDQIFGSRRRD